MSVAGASAPGRMPATHPEVFRRRVQEWRTSAVMVLVPAITALAVTIGLPNTSIFVVLAIIAGLVGVFALMTYQRLEVTVTLVIVYLGVLNGPVKLFFSGREITASMQDVVILAVAGGALFRAAARRERMKLPALSGWVVAWVVLVVVNAFNPKTESFLHILGGFRQNLEYVPFFFFGYLLLRSKDRFRKLFILLGIIATLNGIVTAYQTTLSPSQLASWGPGYAALIKPEGKSKGSGRVYFSEGEARVRPPGLGSEAGSSGTIGHIVLPMCLALLVIVRRKKWLVAGLCVGTAIAVLVSLSRLTLVGSVLGVICFLGYAALAGRKFGRTMAWMLVFLALLIPAGALVVSALRKGTFKRYENLGTGSSTTLHKENSWDKIPKYAAASPFGFGLGNSGAVSGLGGHSNNLLEGHGLTSETEYNVLIKELGVPGLILWPVMIIYISLLAAKGMPRIRDGDIAICLAGTLGAYGPLLIEGGSGFLSASPITGPYIFAVVGICSYWFMGPGRNQVEPEELPADPRPIDQRALAPA
jgi:hypothetical protein